MASRILPFHRLTIITESILASDAEKGPERLGGLLCVLSRLGLAGIAAIACFWRVTVGTRPQPRVFKHLARAFHPNTHTRSFSALSVMAQRLAFACCDNVVVVGQRHTTQRIKRSVRIELF